MGNQKNSNFPGGVTMTKIIDLSVIEKIRSLAASSLAFCVFKPSVSYA